MATSVKSRGENYDAFKAVKDISKKSGLLVNGKTIQVLKSQSDVGNGTWGKIDYLTNHCGYKQIFVEKFN